MLSVHLVAAIGAVCLFVMALAAVPAQCQGTDWQARRTGVAIPMRDGKSLAADLFLPKVPGAYPTIVIQTPYNRTRIGSALPDASEAGSFLDGEHYALVVVDWRGFFGSGPALDGVRVPRRGRDGFDVVEWIARQPWSNGKVGTWGPSALGKIQFLTAQEQPPHLTCCVPVVASHGYTYGDYYENGVYREAHVKLLDRLGLGASAVARNAPDASAPLYRMAERAVRPQRFAVPMLLITGWYDPGVREQLRTFDLLQTSAGETARRTAKMVIGPWHHTAVGESRQGALQYPGAAGERDRVSRLFFDAWLRGDAGNGWDATAPFRWWQMGEECWYSADGLGAVETEETTLTLHADGRISGRYPGAREGARLFTADPANPVPTRGGANVGHGSAGGLGIGPQDQSGIESRGDVLVYTTAPLQAPLRIFGAATLSLSFAIDRPDATFAVRLCDVYPDGQSMLICDGVTRARYRDGSGRPAPVEPDKPYTASLSLPPTAITLPEGHRLRVSICGSNAPRFEVNLNTGADHFDAATAVPARCTILHDTDHPTALRIPLLIGAHTRS